MVMYTQVYIYISVCVYIQSTTFNYSLSNPLWICIVHGIWIYRYVCILMHMLCKCSKKITYQIDIRRMQQENIRTGQLRAVRRTGASNRISMIARHMEGHNSVMIRAAPSEGCRIRWWLPSGSRVFTAMPPDTTEYVLIFPDPSMAHCWDPSWPQPSGYIKTRNLATLESESRLALIDALGHGELAQAT